VGYAVSVIVAVMLLTESYSLPLRQVGTTMIRHRTCGRIVRRCGGGPLIQAQGCHNEGRRCGTIVRVQYVCMVMDSDLQ
jgi:hypothetical protein